MTPELIEIPFFNQFSLLRVLWITSAKRKKGFIKIRNAFSWNGGLVMSHCNAKVRETLRQSIDGRLKVSKWSATAGTIT